MLVLHLPLTTKTTSAQPTRSDHWNHQKLQLQRGMQLKGQWSCKWLPHFGFPRYHKWVLKLVTVELTWITCQVETYWLEGSLIPVALVNFWELFTAQYLSLVTEHRTPILLKTKTAPKGNAVKSGERTPSRMTGEEQVTGLLEWKILEILVGLVLLYR